MDTRFGERSSLSVQRLEFVGLCNRASFSCEGERTNLMQLYKTLL
jgi:hypothetical protein